MRVCRVPRWAPTGSRILAATGSLPGGPALIIARRYRTGRPPGLKGLRRLFIALLLAATALSAASLTPASTAAAGAAPITAYRGLGSWVDIYDPRAWEDPAGVIADMASHGVRTLYLETANHRINVSLYRKPALNLFIEQAHARKMKVVAWYLPGLEDVGRDLRRSLAAINYRTPSGQRFDSFALDIEDSRVRPASLRSERVGALSRQIRAAVGDSYPLGGIIPSPVGMELRPSYWPGFPYRMVAEVYDVILPMGYYTYHGDGAAQAYRETLENVRLVREKTGRQTAPIHVIGGLGDASTGAETQAYVRALRQTGCLGGGLYDWSTTNEADWRALANVRYNLRQRPALPVPLGYLAPLGNCPQDATHPKEVFFVAPGQDGDRVLRLRLWDAQADELRLVVNWKQVRTFGSGPRWGWTNVRVVRIPARLLKRNSPNVIALVARGEAPTWRRWGVRDLTLTEE